MSRKSINIIVKICEHISLKYKNIYLLNYFCIAIFYCFKLLQFLILGLVQRRPSSSSNKKKQKNLEYKLINGYNPAGIMPTGSKPFEGRVSLYLFALGSSPYSRPQTIGYLGVRQDGSI